VKIYRDTEKERIIAMRDTLFRDEGGGYYKGKAYPFVLKNPRLNLWDGIREDVFQYFESNQVAWWGEGKNQVTGHLLSSQVACLNNLYPMRQRQDMATAVLRSVRDDIACAIKMDSGYVEFEVVGDENYLGEKSHTRGIHSTSIDAVMVGKKKDGANILVMIEWKYTEEYPSKDLYIPARAAIYDKLITAQYSPIRVAHASDLYYEPFYQLMRQTLLGWMMVRNREYGCDEYMHLHVIPQGNHKLQESVTSPGLAGETMCEAWQKCLVRPEKYQVLTPETLISPIAACVDTQAIVSYLSSRYWAGDQ